MFIEPLCGLLLGCSGLSGTRDNYPKTNTKFGLLGSETEPETDNQIFRSIRVRIWIRVIRGRGRFLGVFCTPLCAAHERAAKEDQQMGSGASVAIGVCGHVCACGHVCLCGRCSTSHRTRVAGDRRWCTCSRRARACARACVCACVRACA